MSATIWIRVEVPAVTWNEALAERRQKVLTAHRVRGINKIWQAG